MRREMGTTEIEEGGIKERVTSEGGREKNNSDMWLQLLVVGIE